MKRVEFLEEYGTFLAEAGIVHFRAYEGCDVGRVHPASGVILEAPGLELWENSLSLWRVLEWLREEAGGRAVSVKRSCFRDPEYNRVCGGADHSLHPLFCAGDVEVLGRSPEWVVRRMLKHPEAGVLGIGLYGDFSHIDTRGLVVPSGGIVKWPARWGGRMRWWE